MASPKVVKITPGVSASATQSSTRPHRQHADRAARSMHKLDRIGQHGFDAELEDRMRVAAADLHERERAMAADIDPCDELLDFPQQRFGLLRIAELVDIFHRLCSLLLGCANLQVAPLVGQQRVHQIPKNVIDRDVAFLNAVDAVGLDDQTMIEACSAPFLRRCFRPDRWSSAPFPSPCERPSRDWPNCRWSRCRSSRHRAALGR